MDWNRAIDESDRDMDYYLERHIDNVRRSDRGTGSPAAKEEKRAISGVAVKKGLPLGITKHIGKFLGKSSKGGRKTRRNMRPRKTRKGGRAKKSRGHK
jgi:hypothetical protein